MVASLEFALANRAEAKRAYLPYYSADRMIDESLDYYRAALRDLKAPPVG
jgi:hypothetical protein